MVPRLDDDRLWTKPRADQFGCVAASRVTVTGTLSLVGDYEWDAFDLIDTRTSWHVRGTALADRGDEMLDLVPVTQADS